MSDPLSTAASVVTVLSTCLALAEKLQALRSASSDLECLSNDMTEISTVLLSLKQQIDNIIRSELQDDGLPAMFMANINPALSSCMSTFNTLGKYLERQKKEIGSTRGKLRWLWGANELAGMRAQLSEKRVTLSMALVATSCILNYNIACTTKSIQRELTDLTDALSADNKHSSTRNTVGSEISSVLMRRMVWSSISTSSTGEDDDGQSFTERFKRWSKRASMAGEDDDGQSDMEGFKRWSRRASVPTSLKKLRRKTWDSVTPDTSESTNEVAPTITTTTKDARRYGLMLRRRSLQPTLDSQHCETVVEDTPLPPPYTPSEQKTTSTGIPIPQSSIKHEDQQQQVTLPSSLEVFSPDARECGSFASMWEQQNKRAMRWSLVIGKLPDTAATVIDGVPF